MTLELVTYTPPQKTYFDSSGDLELDQAEAIVAAALATSERWQWTAAFALNDIYERELWRKATDDDGQVITNFETYIRLMRQRIPRLGVRWAQEHISMIGMYMGAMGLEKEDLMLCSPSKLRDAKRLAKWDQRKGEITGYRVPNGEHVLIEMVKDAQEPGVSTGDLRRRVNSLLKRPDISYSWVEGVGIRVFHDDLAWDIEVDQKIPDGVLSDIRRRLGCQG